MPDTHEFKQLNWYPHMGPEDAAIWHRFIAQFPDAYDRVQYDVKVGKAPDFVTEHEDEAMRAQAPLYQRKIDVIGYKADQIDIIEVKPNAGASAIGQVKQYRHLWSQEYMPPETPKCVIVTDNVKPDTGEFAHAEGVLIVVV